MANHSYFRFDFGNKMTYEGSSWQMSSIPDLNPSGHDGIGIDISIFDQNGVIFDSWILILW